MGDGSLAAFVYTFLTRSSYCSDPQESVLLAVMCPASWVTRSYSVKQQCKGESLPVPSPKEE